MAKGKILVVDDEKLIRWSLREEFRKQDYLVDTAQDAREALASIEGKTYDMVFLDLRLPDAYGIDLLHDIKRVDPHLCVTMMTGHGEIEIAVQAMRAGACDFITKPLDHDRIRQRMEKVLGCSRPNQEGPDFREDHKDQRGGEKIIGRSNPIQQLLGLVRKMALSDSTVLILGESGTGKDLLAHYIHSASSRAERTFVDINCAALPDTLLESELMGHEKGAFTDAKASKKGLFEQADGGTVFLDEIGDMPLSIQAKVLKLIETKRFRRLGGIKDIEVDVRIIAATNKNLAAQVIAGNLREDLYYRLKVLSVHAPPLRERKLDIPLLAEHFLGQFNRDCAARKVIFAQDALDVLLGYDWPGNVRELKNVIERAVILSDGSEVLPEHLPPEIVENGRKTAGFDLNDLEIPGDGLPLELVERDVIEKVLQSTGGNISRAARILHVSRDTLRYRTRKLGIRESR
jgi:two-component system response regulator AtoC